MPAHFSNDRFLELAKKWPGTVPRYLYKHFHQKLIHLAQQRTNNRQASEDIVQEIFIEIWRKLDQLTAREGFLVAPYLLMLVRHKSITYFWKSTLTQSISPDTLDTLLKTRDTAEDKVLYAERIQQLHTWVDQLPVRERETLKLKYFEGLANEIIADRLGVSKKSVERRITSGIRILQKQVRNR